MSQNEQQLQLHDDAAVDAFCEALKEKLAQARAKGRNGWRDPSWSPEQISKQLELHIAKGDPLDVAAYAMFLHQRGEPCIASGLTLSPRKFDEDTRMAMLEELMNKFSNYKPSFDA